jgi:hypothetical protein
MSLRTVFVGYSLMKKLQIVILLIYLATHGLLSINLFEFMLWSQYFCWY